MRKPRTHKICGVKYKLDIYDAWEGKCDDPNEPAKRELCIPGGLKHDQKTMEILIHEHLHASSFHTREEVVEQAAYDLAKLLFKLYKPRF